MISYTIIISQLYFILSLFNLHFIPHYAIIFLLGGKQLHILFHKLKDIIFSIIPLIVLVFILHFTVSPIETSLLKNFLFGALFIIFGLTIFLIGVDIGIAPIGNRIGEKLTKSNSLFIILFGGFILGLFISIAEPDLHVIANQIELFSLGMISKYILILTVSLGIALTFSFGLFRIFKSISLRYTLLFLYSVVFILIVLSPPDLLAITFDAAGATTGSLAVPFMLAISLSISRLKKLDVDSGKDSFGLIGIVSAGALIGALILSMIIKTINPIDDISLLANNKTFFTSFIPVIKDVLLSLSPIIIFFLIFNKFSLQINKSILIQIYKGLLYAFIGMVLFLVGVNGGFLEVGRYIGSALANYNIIYLALICFLLGVTSILAEPAVYVLTKQIEEVTSGYIKKIFVMTFLALGVGIALTLALLRIKFDYDLAIILLVGYSIAVILSFLVPKIFVGMAFDSGGVTSGPMTVTFILAFFHGVAHAVDDANILVEGFGMVSLVVLAPIITLQLLGLIYKIKTVKGGIE